MTQDHEQGFFTEANSAEVVAARNAKAKDARTQEIANAVIKHLHAAIREIEPTQKEWLDAIKFLTAVGDKCDDWRQEFVLLSDTLGVSMLVDAINNRKPSGASESTVLGPFHIEGSPELEMGADICQDNKGEPMHVSGRILDTDGKPITNAKIDVWQANDEGFYDVQQKGIQPEFNLRGIFRTGDDGKYWFKGVKPKHYSIPADGPVGKMLENLGRHPYRPAHLHYIISADGFEELTTHLFTPDDPYLNSDAVFGVKESLIADFIKVTDKDEIIELGFTEAEFCWKVEYDFVLAKAK